MIDPEIVLPQPAVADHDDNDMWLDERIWGHRLFEKQSPWLMFLECLVVADACHREKTLLNHGTNFYPLPFQPQQRMYLRNIVFNNQPLFEIAERNQSNDAAWSEWLGWMSEHARGVPTKDFSYLKPRFQSFSDFAALVGMLRASAVEADSNKRWSSRFVFPFGSEALYEDLAISPQGTPNREYINFGRTGELLYMMLARSSSAPKLVGMMTKLLDGRNQWNALLKVMQPVKPGDTVTRSKSFLPYKRHRSFDRLGQDWLGIERLGLPGFDAIPRLVTLSAFGLFLYELEVASEWARKERPYFVCEVVGPRKTLVREVSTENYQVNHLLPENALRQAIRDLEEGEPWRVAAQEDGAYVKCKALLSERFRWPADDEYQGTHDPTALINAFRRKALARHKKHVANVHRVYGRDIGLVSKRGTNRLRYAPNDGLLKALILANVEKRMELNEFLELLVERYGLVFGDRVAARVLPKEDYDQNAFRANARRLEQRLASLGMLNRLSDACAYVRNPFAVGHQ